MSPKHKKKHRVGSWVILSPVAHRRSTLSTGGHRPLVQRRTKKQSEGLKTQQPYCHYAPQPTSRSHTLEPHRRHNTCRKYSSSDSFFFLKKEKKRRKTSANNFMTLHHWFTGQSIIHICFYKRKHHNSYLG